MSIAYLSFGSNLGDRAANLLMAIDRLNGPDCRVLAVSSFYETSYIGGTPDSAPEYLNCAARIATDLDPHALLNYTQDIERAGGRIRKHLHSPRTIDIDLLLYDNVTLETDRLVIPHPRLRERAFVLVPLSDIQPDLKLPDGTAVQDLLIESSVANQRITPWSDPRPASV